MRWETSAIATACSEHFLRRRSYGVRTRRRGCSAFGKHRPTHTFG